MGWWVGGREIDWAFVHEEFKTWEMVLCEALAGVVPWAEQAIIYHFFGLKAGKRRGGGGGWICGGSAGSYVCVWGGENAEMRYHGAPARLCALFGSPRPHLSLTDCPVPLWGARVGFQQH